MERIIGIDVGGTSIKWGRVDSDGRMIVSGRRPTEREHPREVLTKIVEIVAAQEGLEKIGLSFPGMVAPDGSLVTAGAIIGLEGTPLRAEIEQLTGLPTAVVNDAHAAGQAERWLGAGADCDNFVCMTLGTGIGGAIFINGKLYRGFRVQRASCRCRSWGWARLGRSLCKPPPRARARLSRGLLVSIQRSWGS